MLNFDKHFTRRRSSLKFPNFCVFVDVRRPKLSTIALALRVKKIWQEHLPSLWLITQSSYLVYISCCLLRSCQVVTHTHLRLSHLFPIIFYSTIDLGCQCLSPPGMSFRQRLLHDITELKRHPYPGIGLHVDDNIEAACLVLWPSGRKPVHLTMSFSSRYPLASPKVQLDKQTETHRYSLSVCPDLRMSGISPLNTIKSYAIQLLGLFNSDQSPHKGETPFQCVKCGFGRMIGSGGPMNWTLAKGQDILPDWMRNTSDTIEIPIKEQASAQAEVTEMNEGQNHCDKLPPEIILPIFDFLETEDLVKVADVCVRFRDIVIDYNLIQARQVQCFCIRQNYRQTKLGIGVHVSQIGRQWSLDSEFDFISEQAFKEWGVRRSALGHPFEHWVPLPLSEPHWISVSNDVRTSLEHLGNAANITVGEGPGINVVYGLIAGVIASMSRRAEIIWTSHWDTAKTHMAHASERAIESLFGLFHLQLCLATEHSGIIRDANRHVQDLLKRKTSKRSWESERSWGELGREFSRYMLCTMLLDTGEPPKRKQTATQDCARPGLILTEMLISDQPLTEDLINAVIEEATIRNVVWMLDPLEGAGMSELYYIEPSSTSEYRLQRTFAASRPLYRALMFLVAFIKVVRESGKSITEFRDDLFKRKGAPPKAMVEDLAARFRHIQKVDNFSQFFDVLGLEKKPSKKRICRMLKEAIQESEARGYSRPAMTPGQALALRMMKEPSLASPRNVRLNVGLIQNYHCQPFGGSFFPEQSRPVSPGREDEPEEKHPCCLFF